RCRDVGRIARRLADPVGPAPGDRRAGTAHRPLRRLVDPRVDLFRLRVRTDDRLRRFLAVVTAHASAGDSHRRVWRADHRAGRRGRGEGADPRNGRRRRTMKKSIPAASPDAYVAALSGWQRKIVEHLRSCVRTNARLDEVIKWGNIVYMSNGPAIVIRAEEKRVLFGFWRGRRLREIDGRL